MKQNRMNLSDHITDWLNVYLPEVRGCSSKTVDSYESAIYQFLEYLESVKNVTSSNFNETCFSRENVEGWLKWLMSEKKNSRLTRDHRLAVLKSLLEYLKSRDIKYYLYFNSVKDIKGISHGRGKEVKPLSRKAIKAFFEAIDCTTAIGQRDFALFTLMYDLAARVGEALGLRIKDVCEDEDGIYVRLYGKGAKTRTLDLSPTSGKTLMKYIELFHGQSPSPDSFVFFSPRGCQYMMSEDTVNARLVKIASIAHSLCSEVPLKMHSHQLRHTALTHWIMDGVNIAVASGALGHENINTTIKYLGISREELQSALSKRKTYGEKEQKKYKNLKNGLKGLIRREKTNHEDSHPLFRK